ncbi:MAG: Tn7 transposase TnsA N-terminal domain-containing protein [Methylobacter sp.]|nr:Tn7 transposase TnsA N-terminal domain-containing protein [Methylobacter sp.]
MSIDNYGQRKNAGYRAALRLNIVPQPKAERAREPVTRSRGLVRGQFPSTKMKRMIAWESQQEEKACYHFEVSPVVKAFREQPKKLYLPSSKGMSRYTPDFELMLHNGEFCYVEVKPLSKLFSPQVLEKLRAADQLLSDKGYHFIVLTDEELNFPTRIRNFPILRPYLRFDIPLQLIQQANEWLAGTSDPTLEALSQFLGFRSTAFALLAQLHICFEFDQPIENSSELFSPTFGDHHETCFFSYRTGPDFKQCAVPTDPHA